MKRIDKLAVFYAALMIALAVWVFLGDFKEVGCERPEIPASCP